MSVKLHGDSNQNPAKGFQVFSEAIAFYRSLGYQLVTVPWLVSEKSIRATYDGPNEGVPTTSMDELKYRQMVGSAEQSFLEVFDKLENGKRYMAVTPCMRDESPSGGFNAEECRLPGFMKLELFVKGMHASESMRKAALRFFRTWCGSTVYDIEVAKGWDIMTRTGIELGSYYDTRFEGIKYSCGTGMAWERLLHAQGIKVPNLWLNSTSKVEESTAPSV